MEVIVSGRHMEVDPPVREFAQERIQRLADEYSKLTIGHVVLSHQRGRFIVDGHVNGKHVALNATGKADDTRAAIDAMYEKLERQLRKYLERIQNHRAPSLAEVESEELAAEAANVEDEDLEEDFGG